MYFRAAEHTLTLSPAHFTRSLCLGNVLSLECAKQTHLYIAHFFRACGACTGGTSYEFSFVYMRVIRIHMYSKEVNILKVHEYLKCKHTHG